MEKILYADITVADLVHHYERDPFYYDAMVVFSAIINQLCLDISNNRITIYGDNQSVERKLSLKIRGDLVVSLSNDIDAQGYYDRTVERSFIGGERSVGAKYVSEFKASSVHQTLILNQFMRQLDRIGKDFGFLPSVIETAENFNTQAVELVRIAPFPAKMVIECPNLDYRLGYNINSGSMFGSLFG